MTELYAVESDGKMLDKGRYDAILVREGKAYDDDGDMTVTKRIRGPLEVVGVAKTYESARSDDDRGHARILALRGEQYFIAGCKYTSWAGETNNFYVNGPLTLDAVLYGVDGKPDIALLNSARLAKIEDL